MKASLSSSQTSMNGATVRRRVPLHSEGVFDQKLGHRRALVLLFLDLRFVFQESQSIFIDLGFSNFWFLFRVFLF